jgi:DNA-binding NarL/FixJ family response regulator
MAHTLRVLLVDDHVLIREALRGVLEDLRGDANIWEASNYCEAIELIEQHSHFDLVVLDLTLPDCDGFAMLAELRERCPSTAVIVLSASCEHSHMTRALELGAAGYIPKSTGRDVMLGALRLVFSGGIYVPAEILNHEQQAACAATLATGSTPADLGLTERQGEVLALLMQGKSNKAIAAVLDLTEATVKNYVTAILKVLKVNSRTQAVIVAAKMDLGCRENEDAGVSATMTPSNRAIP